MKKINKCLGEGEKAFEKFITPKLVKFLFIISIILCALVSLSMFLSGLGMLRYSGVGILWILLSPLVFLVGVIYVRVLLETVIIFFKMERHLSQITRVKEEREN